MSSGLVSNLKLDARPYSAIAVNSHAYRIGVLVNGKRKQLSNIGYDIDT